MRNNTKNRFISGLLTGVMMLNQIPVFAAAEDTGLCEHHTSHENCGYVEGVSGIHCGHEHRDCYVLVESCIHEHVECGYSEIPEENLCAHECTEDNGCITEQLNCAHVHGECGYQEEVVAQPCDYECRECAENNSDAPETVDVGDDQVVSVVDSGSCGDNLTWNLDSDGTLTISGTGEMWDYSYGEETHAPWYFNLSVTQIVIENGVTSIGDYAFGDCRELMQITIPESVIRIGCNAFEHCSSLRSINLPDSITSIGGQAFRGSGLTSIVIPNGVTCIEYDMFNHCESLQSVTFPDSVISIGDGAFSVCSSLPNITIPNSVTHIGEGAFMSCYSFTSFTIPTSVTSISDMLFRRCFGLESVTIPDGVTSIGSSAFEYCEGLTTVSIPNSVTSIGSNAFFDCISLTNIIIPSSVSAIDTEAFGYCNKLTDIQFQGDAPIFGSDVFINVTANAYYPINNSTWQDATFSDYGEDITWVGYSDEHIHEFSENSQCICGAYGGLCSENLSWILDAEGALTISGTGAMDDFDSGSPAPWDTCRELIKSVVIEDGVTTIGVLAFTEYQKLTTLSIPKSVSKISSSAIVECNNLESVTVDSDNETYLSENGILFNKDKTVLLKYPAAKADSFYTIPDSVVTIEEYAFYKCSNLNNVFFGNSVSTIGFQAFVGCSGMLNLNIPDSVTTIDATAFADCTSLSVANIGSGIKYLNNYVFENCTSLHIVLLPETLEEIWENAFAYCSSLKRIELPAGMNFISDGAFHDCTALEEIVINGVKEFYWSLENCTALKTVIFTSDAPDYCTDAFQTLTLTAYYPAGNSTWTDAKRQSFGGNITWIATDSSGNCGENLTWSFNEGTLTISGTGDMYDYSQDQTNLAPWTHLGDDIKKLVVEEGVTSIGDYAFDCCTGLKKTFIPQSISRVGTFAFANVTDARFEINQTVRQWSKIQEETQYFPCWEHTSFVNPAPIVASGLYGEHVFWELDDQGDMVFFGSGDMYDFGAVPTLWGEQSVKSVTIEEGITRIGIGAFEVSGVDIFSKTFASVTIPSTVTSIGGMAFSNCKALKEIVFSGDAPVFDLNPFNGVTATAYYPAGNETWTTAVMQDYEGDITWEAYCIDHIFGEWIDKDNTSSRTCTLCGYTEHKVTTDSGDVEIEIPDQPDLEVEVDPVFPSEDDYILVEELLKKTGNPDQAIIKIYDINLKNADGDHVQLIGKVTVKLPLGQDTDGNYKVYRVNDDGTLTDMNAYRQGSQLVFDTEHFSLYVVIEATEQEVAANAILLNSDDFDGVDAVWADGIRYPVVKGAEGCYVQLPENTAATNMITYTYHVGDANDVHTQYPTGMKVWQVTKSDSGYTVKRLEALDNILQYSGSSIRITGNKGIRMITSVPMNKKAALTGAGLEGYKLLEYGTVLSWASDLAGGNPLVLGKSYAKHNYAYKRGVADPVFAYSGNLVQYTNVLVGFTNDQCKDDVAMRSYMILENEKGEQVTLYGGIVYRSIGYIAYQNRAAFNPGSAAYQYVWDIIHSVYGKAYDAEYKG